ncbi:GH32 C-terminal domain-containing protein [Saccharibacillus sp. CPCC 101409]|uniref:glycoside hydrolase family 32 protein n=1 Tax=Saccharibacillus sp. CPCC 101409 TaxID=3058041 RepID=UPI00267228BA|nr:GH32 C-terminal domain-containing protein [Saccharibacillus sp. CPCC 101409]MDO3408292.1 GH32 C-terminal domain-containing protein [Saccharibacillus sp. CPCC 101409]
MSVQTGRQQPDYRGSYHFSPKANWINDPNGLVHYDGEYHLFFQYHPFGTIWGPMHWGHAVSSDLVHWEELNIALVPDEHGAIFSGSAVVDWNNTSGFFSDGPGLVAVFTHHAETPGRPFIQHQSLAYSADRGRTWTKYEGNPVLRSEAPADFRDPKVFWHADTSSWVMILACGQVVKLFRSPDLKNWTESSSFGDGIGCHDGVWECPDLFPLAVDGDSSRIIWVMLVSVGAQPNLAEGSRTQYFTGNFDGRTFVPDEASRQIRWLDYGRDNYAGVSWSDVPAEDGRRLYIGWMSNWHYANQTPTEGWRGAMTIVRELTLETHGAQTVLVQRPTRELEERRRPLLELGRSSAEELNEALDKLAPRLPDGYEVTVRVPEGVSFGVRVKEGAGAADVKSGTLIGVDAAANTLYVDRTRSGVSDFHELFAGRHTAPLHDPVAESAGGALELRIFVDRSSVEVFAGDGKAAVTDLIFPRAGANGISVSADEAEEKEGAFAVEEFRLYAIGGEA